MPSMTSHEVPAVLLPVPQAAADARAMRAPLYPPAATNHTELRLHALVRHLVADGDRRAAAAGRRTRRTLDEMTPGASLPPLARMRQRADEACGICGLWSCTGKCWSAAPGTTAAFALVGVGR